jgi:hypothetical protein
VFRLKLIFLLHFNHQLKLVAIKKNRLKGGTQNALKSLSEIISVVYFKQIKRGEVL